MPAGLLTGRRAVSEMVGKKLAPATWPAAWPPTACRPELAGFANSFPDTAFAENVGLVGLTQVRSRWPGGGGASMPGDGADRGGKVNVRSGRTAL